MNPARPENLPRLFSGPDRVRLWPWIVAGAILAYGVVTWLMLRETAIDQIRFRLDLAPLLESTLAIRVHAVAALSSLLLGSIILLLPKGTGLHKPLGWVWVGLMAVTALSSFFIRSIIPDSFSPIHALSAWTLISLPMGIAAIRQRNVKAHRYHMSGMFLGGMLIAGLFTFLPGRIMWSLFFTA